MGHRVGKWVTVAVGSIVCGWGCTSQSSSPAQPNIYACGELPDGSSSAGILPSRPAGPVASGPSGTWAVSKLYYGDTDRDGQTSCVAWQTYGLNIDGKTTVAASTDVCTPVPGTSRQAQVDGQNGIDNSFGANVVPVLATLDLSFSTKGDTGITQGGATMLLSLDHWIAGPSHSPSAGALLRAAPSSRPRWDGTDVRDVNRASLIGDSGTAWLSFPDGYVAQGTWVGEPPSSASSPLDLELRLGHFASWPLTVTHVQFAMSLAPHSGSSPGVLAGVIRTEDMVSWFKATAGAVSMSLCTGSAFASIAMQVEQMSDIMADGTNAPGATCNGISLGLGLDAVPVKTGVVVDVPSLPDSCADAGADDGGAGDAVVPQG